MSNECVPGEVSTCGSDKEKTKKAENVSDCDGVTRLFEGGGDVGLRSSQGPHEHGRGR